MILEYVTQFRVVGVCLDVCVCSVSYMVLSVMGGRTPKYGADLEGVYCT